MHISHTGMNKIQNTMMLLLFISFPFACSKNHQTGKETMSRQTAAWPVFRGDRNLSGVAEGRLPEKMSVCWSFDTGSEIVSSPVIGLESVFIGSTNGKVYAIGLCDGQQKWVFDSQDDIEAPPLLLNETVFIGNLSGDFFAIDARTGKEKWRAHTGGNIMGSANWASVSMNGETLVIVGSYDTKMYAFDAETGALKWTYETGYYINGAPATDGGNVVFGGCDRMLHIVSVTNGVKRGAVDTGSYIAGSAALVEGRAYVGNYEGKLVCIHIAGQKIVWEYKNGENPGGFFSSPAIGKKRIYIGSRDRFLHCIDRETGIPLWKFRTRGDVDSSPVIAGDKLLLGSTDGRLYMIDCETGKEIWSYEIGASITGSPAVIDGMVVIGAADGRVYAFGETK